MSPICDDKTHTDKIFNNSLEYIIKNIDDFGLFIGSHNEKSNLLSTELLKKYKIKTDDDRIWFSQLYGMSDNISFSLANNGYNVAKYLPFGPVKEVKKKLVFELAFDSIHKSSRHKSGLALRFPRVSLIRWDKPANEVLQLQQVKDEFKIKD